MDKNIIKQIVGLPNIVIYDGIKEWFDTFPFFEFLRTIKTTKYQKKNLINTIITSFDIETTRIDDLSFCYILAIQYIYEWNTPHHT